IADGHHRTASSYLLRQIKKDNSTKAMNHFMSYLLCENSIQINEYNRVVHDLNGHSADDFIKILQKNYLVKQEHEYWIPINKFTCGMYLEGTFYLLVLIYKLTTIEVIQQIDAQIFV